MYPDIKIRPYSSHKNKNVSKPGEYFPATRRIKNRQKYIISNLSRFHEFVVKSILTLYSWKLADIGENIYV